MRLTIFVLLSVLSGCMISSNGETIVSRITPQEGSLKGATRITIYGSGFAVNQFNFGADAAVGNLVDLVSGTRVFPCDIHKDGCTQIQLMCNTRPMPEDSYYIRVFVDGVLVPTDYLCQGGAATACRFKARELQTPLIQKISPPAGLPGDLIEVYGRMFTSLYETNKTEGPNGAIERLKRVYLGGQMCDLRISGTDDYYGLSLHLKPDGNYSDYGQMICLPKGTYVGNQNFSYLIDGPYGRSMPDLEVLRITAQNQITMYQTFAEVTGVSPSSGSVVGGTLLTIMGRYFDESDAPIQVKVGGVTCRVQSVEDNQLICEVGEQPTVPADHYPGNRGVVMKTWHTNETSEGLLDIPSFTATPTSVEFLDQLTWHEPAIDTEDDYMGQVQGYFIPPSDNEYRFFLMSDDISELWLSTDSTRTNMMMIASDTRYRTSYAESDRFSLTKGQPLFMEVLYKESVSNASLSVGVHAYKTEYTAQQAGTVHNEVQKLVTGSTILHETQRLTIVGWKGQSGTDEKQVIDLASQSLQDAVFRIGIYGVYTGPLNGLVPVSTLRTELGKLPNGPIITVTADDTDTTRTLTLTFTGDRGDWPDFSIVEDPTSPVPITYSVTERKQGVPSLRYLVLSFEGVPATPIFGKDAKASDIKTSLTSIFSARCPVAMDSPMGAGYHETYEGRMSGFAESGARVTDREAFCGKYSSLNPGFIYLCCGESQREIDIFLNPHLCFAYKGDLDNVLTLNYDGPYINVWRRFDVEFPQNNDHWVYHCIDLAQIIGAAHTDLTSAILKGIYISRNGSVDVLIDNVYIGSVKPTDDADFGTYRRLVPRHWSVRDVSVRKEADGTFDVTIGSYDCAHDFPLIGVEHGPGSGTSEVMTYSGRSWPTGTHVQISRVLAASPPVGGTFSITYGGRSINDIPAAVEAMDLQDLLETLPDMGKLSVKRIGTCSGYQWKVEWRTISGDHPQLILDSAGILGADATMTITTKYDGGLFFTPIPGDMLRTAHTEPQVSVVVNNIPSLCTGDCSFQWNISATPQLTAVSPTQGSITAGTVLTLSGDGFDVDTPSNNVVVIGGTPCVVTGFSGANPLCSVGAGPAGTHDVILRVLGRGLAAYPAGVPQFTYAFAISDLSPAAGGLGGGMVISLTGTGFGSSIRITVGGNDCPVLESNYDTVTCITPAGVAAVEVVVTVTDGSTAVTSPTGYTYNAALTTTITDISETVALVSGGTTIVLEGSNFGVDQLDVRLNDRVIQVIHHNDTHIMVQLLDEPAGEYQLLITVAGGGYAVYSDNTVPVITYTLTVTSVTPRRGSLYGGTKLTINGVGFGSNLLDARVTVGRSECVPTTIGQNELQCIMATSAETHIVTNQGVHPDSGPGYAWLPQSLDVSVGDTVRWQWSTPALLDGVAYTVEQTGSPSAIQYKPSGFKSGPKSRLGAFEYEFSSPGQYYYWSGGAVDDAGSVTMRGVINVTPKVSFAGVLEVTIAGHEARHMPSNGRRRRKRAVVCPDVTLDCTGSNLNDPNTLDFAFLSCATPTVTSIVPTSGDANTIILISGVGFGAQNCQNRVSVGDYSCDVTTSSVTSLECVLDTQATMAVGLARDVVVEVGSSGAALSVISDVMERMFVLLPHIASLTPSSGSVAGGTVLAINGGGFVAGLTSVMIDGVVCDVQNVTYNHISCVTGSAWVTTAAVTVNVQAQGQWVTSECSANCDFSYSFAETPEVEAVSPVTITNIDEIMTITGSGFSASEVLVYIGTTECDVTQSTDTEITCNAGRPVAGQQPLSVLVRPQGQARLGVTSVQVVPGVPNIHPISGSLGGGTPVTISGFGFSANHTMVTVGGNPCLLLDLSDSYVTCRTPPGVAATVDLELTSNDITYITVDFTYSATYTAGLISSSIVRGSPGDVITFTVTNMVADDAMVTIETGGAPCVITTITTTSITCVLGQHEAGSVDVSVLVRDWGYATGALTFAFDLSISGILPDTGSYGGTQLLTVDGNGFTEGMVITVCGDICRLDVIISSAQATCLTPPNSGSGDTACDVMVSYNGLEDTLATSYTYSDSLTPSIISINPRRGGTGGGTSITITGTGFGSSAPDVVLSIAGTTCTTQSVTDTSIICITNGHSPSVMTDVVVEISGNGKANEATPGAAAYRYIDVWSSRFTWGGQDPPLEGDFVIIPSDMTILLDVDTPVLKLLLIQGGHVIFDEVDVELQAEIILINNGGILQVGTEEEPFQHRAIITLHGHPKSKELPIYGTKCIAVREGTLDLHGRPVGITWTHLATTALTGQDTITLVSPVQWSTGDEIIIATTGDRHTQSQNEKRTITSVSGDGMTLTLDVALAHDHLGEEISLTGGRKLQARAEVGLLSHNVLIRGNNNPQWNDVIEACEAGFDTGEFATQTCFQGRFGEEIGSDQFGGQIIMHAPRKDEELVLGRIENVELNYVGQAFRLGRYAIHFHLNGDMPSSYVRGCSIHKSFNRAVNIHATHRVTVEHNVIYDIMGGAFFLEDGVETGNVFQYNLAVFVISSTGLQNDDITPAAFWVTNANNVLRHNAVAGGSHFGFWYRMHSRPDGPSFDPNICPRRVPLGEFTNNTVHSQGWFGIWIFQHFYPMEGGLCLSNTPVPAKFYGLTAWNNEKGAEWVGAGAIQFIDFLLVHNQLTGLDLKLVNNIAGVEFSADGPMIRDALIVASAGPLSYSPTRAGIILPYASGLSIRGVTFSGYSGNEQACFAITVITGSTEDNNGGFKYETQGLTFDSSPNKIKWRWPHEGVYHDLDGTLCGSPGCKVVASNPSLPPECTVASPSFGVDTSVPGSICESSVEFHRFSFNKAAPASLMYKNVTFTSSYGTMFSYFQTKRLTHREGWMVLLHSRDNFVMSWDNAEHITNITYTGTFYDFTNDAYVTIIHDFAQSPDFIHVLEGDDRNATDALTPASYTGDWLFDNDTTKLSYIMSSKTAASPSGETEPQNNMVDLDVFRCFYIGCIPPPDPNTLPPTDTRPDYATFWDENASWNETEDGWGSNYGDDIYGPPLEGDNVKIPTDKWLVIRGPTPVLGQVWIYGGLEFEHGLNTDGQYHTFIFSASHVIIVGGRLVVGWEQNPFHGLMNLKLIGDHFTPDVPLPNGPNVGAKALGVFGGLDLHGSSRVVTWTHLSLTADAGATSLTVEEPVDWLVGDEIVIAPTGFDLEETETRTISAVSESRTTLSWEPNRPLLHRHYVSVESIGRSRTYTMAAEVGLLTRNIKIIGADYPELQEQSFGARVLVGAFSSADYMYSGYARLSNVEFYHSGQEGWTDWYDPRYSLAFLSTGDSTSLKPSYVKSCTFHHGFSPAIGVFGANGLELSNNVIHHTVGSAMIVVGVNNRLIHNLVVQVVHSGVYNGRNERRPEWHAGIETLGAIDVVLQGNSVAGSHRALYHVDGEPCSKVDQSATEMWTDNVGHSSLTGVAVLPKDGFMPCTLLANFTIYRTFDFGMYFQIVGSVKVTNYLSIDNQLGLFPMIFGPSATGHLYADKRFEISQSTFVGRSSVYDCADTLSGPNMDLSDQGRSWASAGGGKVAFSWPLFASGSNGAPTKPWASTMSYQAINGILQVTGVTFASFTSQCSGTESDVVVTTNPNSDDFQHPIEISDVTLDGVDEDKLVFIHRSTLGKINPSDCVDMECDGMKKALLEDLDGSFLGQPGAVIPQSEWAWDMDPRRGVGDYRIPITFLTDAQGNRIRIDDIIQERGIIRDVSCREVAVYQAYVCNDLDYNLLHLESMDHDTETRRISPVSVYSEGYIDLINGPQDHGWCMGYTCQKRLSTFPIILASGKTYEIYYSGTTPQDTKYHWLNTDPSEAVILSTWYAQSWRLNVYVNGQYIEPTNGYYTAESQLALRAPEQEGHYLPDVATDPTGTNYFDRATQMLYVLLRGSTPVDVQTDDTILVTFNLPFMTVDEFFGERIVQNLGAFFDIPTDKIRFAEAVRESRRKRTEAFSFNIEIANQPRSLNVTGVGDISGDAMRALSSSLISAYQLGILGDILNITILSMAIIEPPPPSDSPQWDQYTQMNIAGAVTLVVPELLVISTEPSLAREGNVFTVQPTIQMIDAYGGFVTQLGSISDPWVASVTLEMTSSSDVRAVLGGTTSASFSSSWSNFTDLTISHSGSYSLVFNISDPAGANNFSVVSRGVIVTGRRVAGHVASQPVSVMVNDVLEMSVELMDVDTGLVIDNIGWKDHTWMCEPYLYRPSVFLGPLSGAAAQQLDTVTGVGTFMNLSMATRGQYVIDFSCQSTPSEYNFTFSSDVIAVYPQGWTSVVTEQRSRVKLRFEGAYNTIVGGDGIHVGAAVHNNLWNRYPDVTFEDFNVSAGSILVVFYISGSRDAVTLTLNDIWEYLKEPMTVQFGSYQLVAIQEMLVDGASFYGLDGAPSTGLSGGAIAGIVLAVAVVVILIIVLAWYFMKKKKKGVTRKTLKHRDTLFVYGHDDGFEKQQIVKGGSFVSSSSSASLAQSVAIDEYATKILRAPTGPFYPQRHSPFEVSRSSLSSPDEPVRGLAATALDDLLLGNSPIPSNGRLYNIPVKPAPGDVPPQLTHLEPTSDPDQHTSQDPTGPSQPRLLPDVFNRTNLPRLEHSVLPAPRSHLPPI